MGCSFSRRKHLTLITAMSRHFVSSSFANMPHLIDKEGAIPWILGTIWPAHPAWHEGLR